MVKRIPKSKKKTNKLHVATLHIINPPRFRCALWYTPPASARSNQSQETKSEEIE